MVYQKWRLRIEMDLEIETEREVVGERREEKESPELSCLLPLWRIVKRGDILVFTCGLVEI